jgi:hypothetical protein
LSETNYATGKIGSPLDIGFISCKGGQPKFVDGKIRVYDVGTQMPNSFGMLLSQ